MIRENHFETALFGAESGLRSSVFVSFTTPARCRGPSCRPFSGRRTALFPGEPLGQVQDPGGVLLQLNPG